MENVKRVPTDAARLLAEYTVTPVSGEAMVGLFGHDRCTYSTRVPFPVSMAHGVALAFEHNLVGCRLPGEHRR